MSIPSIPESHLAQEAIAALVDGELPAGPAGRAARHLSGCASCRMAVQAQREAKEALHRAQEVAVPGDLFSRLVAIPFTADVPGPGPGGLSAGPDQLTVQGTSGAWSIPLAPPARRPDPNHARWLRRGMGATAAGLGLGVVALALSLPSSDPRDAAHPTGPVVARPAPEQHTTIVPPVVRTLTVGHDSSALRAGSGGTP